MTEISQIAIQKERYFLASIVESSKDSIVTIDFNNIITSWNKAAEDLYGYPANEAIGKELSMVVLPEDIRLLLINIDRIKKNKSVEVYDTIRVRKGGQLIHLEIVLSPVKDEKGEVVGVSTIARDITAWAKADAALRESEARFRALVSQSSVGMYQAGLNRQVTFTNDALLKIYEREADDLVGQPIWSQTFEQDLEIEKQLFENFKSTSKAFETEKRIICKDGKIKWVRESVSPVYSAEGKLESSMGVVIDITDMKEIDRHKDEFISIASHELKTPVTSIKAFAQLLLERFEKKFKGDANLALLSKLNAQVERLSGLVRDLLDTTRISDGRLHLQSQTFDLNEAIKERLVEIQHLSENHKLIFHPQEIRPINGDKERIAQVLTNLVTNAIKYSPGGREVTVATVAGDNEVQVSVRDQGIGIPEALQQKVFDRFFRVDNPQLPSVQGMGLGLYISAQIIERHGGKLSVESNPGSGSVFYFTIPYQAHF